MYGSSSRGYARFTSGDDQQGRWTRGSTIGFAIALLVAIGWIGTALNDDSHVLVDYVVKEPIVDHLGQVLSGPDLPEVVSVEGRFEVTPKHWLTFDWPSTTMVFDVFGTSLVRGMLSGSARYRIRVFETSDGDELLPGRNLTLVGVTQPKPVLLTEGLSSDQRYRVEVARVNEASFEPLKSLQPSVVKSLQVESGGRIVKSTRSKKARKLVVIGDTLTTGFCIEGKNGAVDEVDGVSVQNSELAFPRILATSLDAELELLGISGLGIVTNVFNDPSLGTLATRINRTLESDPMSAWDGSKSRQPDYIVIMAGATDFQGSLRDVQFGKEEFVQKYIELIEHSVLGMYKHMPRTKIFNLCGGPPKASLRPCDLVKAATKETKTVFLQLPEGLIQYPQDEGCIRLWNTAGHYKVAEFLHSNLV